MGAPPSHRFRRFRTPPVVACVYGGWEWRRMAAGIVLWTFLAVVAALLVAANLVQLLAEPLMSVHPVHRADEKLDVPVARLPERAQPSVRVNRSRVARCAAYRVQCMPGTKPAVGRLVSELPEPRAEEFCARRKGHPNRALCKCPAEPCSTGSHFVAHQCNAVSLLPPLDPSGAVDVLLAVSECEGHGLFAQVERILNQLRYADSRGLLPAVYLGERVFTSLDDCLAGRNGYWDHGALVHDGLDSVWDYYFEPVSTYRVGDGRLANGSTVRSVQVVSLPLLYRAAGLGGFDGGALITAYGRTDVYDASWWYLRRRTAHHYVRKYVRVQPWLQGEVARVRASWGATGPVLGMHLRGTDKVVRRKVPPERYFSLADAFLRTHRTGIIFAATDDVGYLAAVRSRYGARVVFRQGGYRVRVDERKTVISDEALPRRAKGADALVDALLLSTCDYLVKTTSALAEFALWYNLSLHERTFDLQFEDEGRSQTAPAWATEAASRRETSLT